jgi:hypothetical protein
MMMHRRARLKPVALSAHRSARRIAQVDLDHTAVVTHAAASGDNGDIAGVMFAPSMEGWVSGFSFSQPP